MPILPSGVFEPWPFIAGEIRTLENYLSVAERMGKQDAPTAIEWRERLNLLKSVTEKEGVA